MIKKQGVPLAFLLSWSCGYSAALRRLERLTGIEDENDFGQRWLGRNVAPKILVKFNNYNCNLRPLYALKNYNCKIFLRCNAVDTSR